jgi:hypothetical protein
MTEDMKQVVTALGYIAQVLTEIRSELRKMRQELIEHSLNNPR